jgi:hypothetical protein
LFPFVFQNAVSSDKVNRKRAISDIKFGRIGENVACSKYIAFSEEKTDAVCLAAN